MPRAKVHSKSAINMEMIRASWIEAMLQTREKVSKHELKIAFNCSEASASHSLSAYAKFNEGRVRYCPVEKMLVARYEFEGCLNGAIPPEQVFSFLNQLSDNAAQFRATPK